MRLGLQRRAMHFDTHIPLPAVGCGSVEPSVIFLDSSSCLCLCSSIDTLRACERGERERERQNRLTKKQETEEVN